MDRENSAPAEGLLAILVAVVLVTYGYSSTGQPGAQQKSVIGNLQLLSTSVDITGLHPNYLTLNLEAVVYNPNAFGAALDAANYSVSANGRYLGSGQTVHQYDLAPQSSQTFNFPISIGWRSAIETSGSYVVSLGAISWDVNGTAIVSLGGLSLAAPFEFTTG